MYTAFITGANRGIGLALVKQYLNLGYQVHATYRSAQSSTELLALDKQQHALHCHQLDVTNYPAVEQLKQTLPAIDLLINNAGYYGPKGYGFGNTDAEQWRQVFEINVVAPLKLVETFYPLLQQGKLKKIACLSSKVGSMTENTSGGGYIYRSSKAALNSVAKSLHNDLSGKGFTVIALHPGWVQTEMGGPNALINTQESATGLVKVINESTPEMGGSFSDYQGNSIPW